MKILVLVNDGYKELLAELEPMSVRARAERIRVLASIGLMAVKSSNVRIAAINQPAGPDGGGKQRLADKLRGSLGD